MDQGPLLDYVPLLGLLLIAAWTDVRRRKIANWLTGGMILSGIIRSAALGGFAGAVHSVAGVFCGGAVPFVLFVIGAVGGGDVKLLAGVGAWLGPVPAFWVYVVQCLLSLVLILVQALVARRTMALFRNTAVLACGIAQGCAGGPDGRALTSIDRPLPFAVPVAAATLLLLLGKGWGIV